MEIERKFLVKELPEALETYPRHQIQQAYISTNPVLRLRRWDESYILTYKGPGLLAREEHEFPLSQESYEHLLTKAEGNSITKDRYCIPFLEYTIELDVFASPFAPLVLAEVEFPDEKAANAFQPPEWFGEEVTYDPAYTNAALSVRKEEKPSIRPGHYRHYKGKEYEVLEIPATPKQRCGWWFTVRCTASGASGCGLHPCGTKRSCAMVSRCLAFNIWETKRPV